MKNKKILGPAEITDENGEPLFDLTNAACSTECTGLIQVPPQNHDEMENYNEVYSFTNKNPQKPKGSVEQKNGLSQ